MSHPGAAIVIDSKKTFKLIKKLDPDSVSALKYEDVKDKIFVLPDCGDPARFMTAREFLQKNETTGYLTITLFKKK